MMMGNDDIFPLNLESASSSLSTPWSNSALNTSADHSLDKLWNKQFRQYATAPFLLNDEDGSSFSYSDAAVVIKMVQGALVRQRLKKGDRIVVITSFHEEAVFLFWACMNLGVVFVPIDANHAQPLLLKIVEKVGPSLIFCDREKLATFDGVSEIKVIVFDSGADDLATLGYDLFSAWIHETQEVSLSPIALSPDDLAVVLFTSGTSNIPKGVKLSHGALYRSGFLVKRLFSLETSDRLLSLGGIHAMSGLRNPCIASVHAGCSVVVPPSGDRQSPFLIVGTISRYSCTVLSTAPAFIRFLVGEVKRIGESALQSLRIVLCTGSELPSTIVTSFYNQYKKPICDYYGLTETAGLCIGVSSTMNQPHTGSIGFPVGAKVQIRGEGGKELPQGFAGELWISSPNLMLGYLDEPETTDLVLQNGWFRTGDLAAFLPNGEIVLKGRMSDIIKNVTGDLIQPGEIESVLETHPNVLEAGVCGIRKNSGEELMVAYIVPVGNVPEEQLFKVLSLYLKEHLGKYRVPHMFQTRESLPRNSYGKLLRRQLIKELKNA